MKLLYLALLFVVVLQACDKDTEPTPDQLLNGTYTGNFHRTGMDTVAVSITFTDNNFIGYSSRPKYPGICRGSWDVTGSTVSFVDSCTWTADFDWTLILSGNYNISVENNNRIKIWRMSGAVKDEYELWRPFR